MDHPPTAHLFVGIDIAAATFTAAWSLPAGPLLRPVTFAQTPDGFVAFQQQLQASAIAPAATLIVMEATSSYWVALAVTLHVAGYQVSVVNPKHLHNYAKSLARRAKTDVLDACMLRQFAAERQPATWTPPPRVYHELRQRLVARDALLEMRQQARNQRHALQQWPMVIDTVVDQFNAVEADLDARIAVLDAEITRALHDGAWAESAALLLSIPGIGPITGSHAYSSDGTLPWSYAVVAQGGRRCSVPDVRERRWSRMGPFILGSRNGSAKRADGSLLLIRPSIGFPTRPNRPSTACSSNGFPWRASCA